MNQMKMMRTRVVVGALGAALLAGGAVSAAGDRSDRPENPRAKKAEKLVPIRVAVFDFDVLKGVDIKPQALTDHINAALAEMPKVTIVNRDQMKKVADEHKLVMTGLADLASAVKLGKFLSAQQIVVGRAGRIGQTYYVIVKLVDVETTVQTTISAKAPADDGIAKVLERLNDSLGEHVRQLQRPRTSVQDAALAKLRRAAKPLAGTVVLVSIAEQHLDRPLKDPAAQMAACNRLRSLGFEVVAPVDPKPGWKRTLLKTGKYDDIKVDYLLEGEGVSAHAAQIQSMISCRARVELRLVEVPGRSVTVSDRGAAAGVDLLEALAAKGALEQASILATDGVVKRLTELKVQGDRREEQREDQ